MKICICPNLLHGHLSNCQYPKTRQATSSYSISDGLIFAETAEEYTKLVSQNIKATNHLEEADLILVEEADTSDRVVDGLWLGVVRRLATSRPSNSQILVDVIMVDLMGSKFVDEDDAFSVGYSLMRGDKIWVLRRNGEPLTFTP